MRVQMRVRTNARAETRAETRAQARAETRAREGTSPKFTKNGLKEKTRSRSRDGAHKTGEKMKTGQTQNQKEKNGG